MQTIEATGPSYWASYLINGDALEDSAEMALADRFVALCLDGVAPVDCQDAGFMWKSDAYHSGVVEGGADCCVYTSLISKR